MTQLQITINFNNDDPRRGTDITIDENTSIASLINNVRVRLNPFINNASLVRLRLVSTTFDIPISLQSLNIELNDTRQSVDINRFLTGITHQVHTTNIYAYLVNILRHIPRVANDPTHRIGSETTTNPPETLEELQSQPIAPTADDGFVWTTFNDAQIRVRTGRSMGGITFTTGIPFDATGILGGEDSQIKAKKNNKQMLIILNFENNEIIKSTNIDYDVSSSSEFPVTVINNAIYGFESTEHALNFGFIEDANSCTWYKPDYNKPVRIHSPNMYFKFKNSKFDKVPSTHLLTEGKKYTFGVEFECSSLLLPQYVYRHLNCDCVRDGSINEGAGGPEIVTGVLNGDLGLNHLQLICKELTLRGSVNKSCGLHLHLGNFDFSKENLVFLYKICLILENEIFNLVPKSRRNNTYCKRLDDLGFKSDINQDPLNYRINLNSDLKSLISHIAFEKKHKNKILSRKLNHPMGPKCGYRHETPRYCWVNFVPAIFNTRESEDSKTIEIRIHSGTTSYTKTKNWFLLWSAVLWFVENKKSYIKEGLTVSEILHEAYPKRGGKISDYFQRRRLQFESAEGENKDYVQEIESIKSIKEEL